MGTLLRNVQSKGRYIPHLCSLNTFSDQAYPNKNLNNRYGTLYLLLCIVEL